MIQENDFLLYPFMQYVRPLWGGGGQAVFFSVQIETRTKLADICFLVLKRSNFLLFPTEIMYNICTFFSIGINPEIRKRSYGETSQFQENFEVYIQALISQCLDANFLDEVFNDAGK